MTRGWTPALCAVVLLCLPSCSEDEPTPPMAVPAVAADAGAPAPSQPVVAQLVRLGGTVALERQGQRSPAQAGALHAQDALETGSEGEAELVFSAGRVVELGPDARVVLSEDSTGVVLEVERGLVLSRVPGTVPSAAEPGPVPAGPEVTLTISTPYGLARVPAEPSSLSVAVGTDGGTVDVSMGVVEFVSRTGEALQAGPGSKLSLSVSRVELIERKRSEPLAAQISPASGRTELRRRGGRSWQGVKKDGEALAEGDALRVRSGEAVMRLSGAQSRMTFAVGAEIVYDRSGRQEGIEEAQFELKRGAVTLNLGPQSRVRLGQMLLESDLGGGFTVVKSRDGYEVRALVGDAVLVRADQRQPVMAGQKVRVRPAGFSAEMAERAELVLPTRLGQRVNLPAAMPVALSWNGEAQDYRVEIAADSSFSKPLLAGRVHGPSVTVTAPRRGTLHWRVFEKNSLQPLDTGSAVFGPEAQSGDLDRLRNDVPEGTEKTTIYYQDKPPSVSFTFATHPKAERYRITVFEKRSLRQVAEKLVARSPADLEAGLLNEGSYAWSVMPLSGTGADLGEGGRMSQLELVYDNSVPSLLIRSPRNGAPVTGSAVPVTGVAALGARLFINGKLAPLDAKQRFDTVASPLGRPPVVVFRLTRPQEPDLFTVRVLRRGR